ncbi:MAG: response regulator transcription factor [Planctomycetaceae bacterium]
MADLLVIDDDANFRSALRRALQLAGHSVREAGDGAEGERLFRAKPADAVVIDLFMPRKEGLETITTLRRQFPGVRILAISGALPSIAGDMLKAAKAFGAGKVLRKPFADAELIAAVEELLKS